MAAQYLDRQRVEGAHPRDALCRLAHDAANAQFHLARGFVGEGHRQNFVGPRLAHGQQMHDPRDQRLGFARACACQHQYGAIQGFNRFALGGVQIIQIGRGTCGKRAARQGNGVKWIVRVGHAPDPSVNWVQWKGVFHFCSDAATTFGRWGAKPRKGGYWPSRLFGRKIPSFIPAPLRDIVRASLRYSGQTGGRR